METNTDEAALLHTILDNPADDAPRLIYADWLQEHGDDEQATFIRKQVANPEETTTDFNELCEIIYRRGFVWMVRCSVPVWVKLGHDLLSRNPIELVGIGNAPSMFVRGDAELTAWERQWKKDRPYLKFSYVGDSTAHGGYAVAQGGYSTAKG